MSLSLRVLGCSGSYAGPDGACTGYLIQSDDASVWLDAGPGTLANLQKYLDLADLDALILTHEHADHWLEVPVLANAMRYYVGRLHFPVFSNASTRDLAMRVMDDPVAAAEVYDWTTVAEGSTVTIKDQTWTFAETEHYVPTLATRVECGGRTLVFTSDTGPGWSPSSLGDAPDVLLCESTFAVRDEELDIQHLSATEAAAKAVECNAGKLVLTHHAPGEDPDEHLDLASGVFAGPIESASIGMRLQV